MPTTATSAPNHPPKLVLGEIISFAYDTFCSNKVRFALTALGMVIGTASLILVVTIGMTGKQYVLNQIQAIGANMVYAEYQGGAGNANPDPLTIDDMKAVLQQVPGIAAASPVVPFDIRVPIGDGKERDVRVLGVFPEYSAVRNLMVLSGRFFDAEDEQAHNKVGVITQKLAEQLYGSTDGAIGKVLKLSGLPFTIIGTFKERVDTFGQSEVTSNTMAIPYTVSRYFTETPEVKQLYFSTTEASMVVPVTERIHKVLQPRHRAESNEQRCALRCAKIPLVLPRQVPIHRKSELSSNSLRADREFQALSYAERNGPDRGISRSFIPRGAQHLLFFNKSGI